MSGPSGPSGLSEAETGSTGDGSSDEADSWQELVTGDDAGWSMGDLQDPTDGGTELYHMFGHMNCGYIP